MINDTTQIKQKSRAVRLWHIGPQSLTLMASGLTAVGRPFYFRRVRPAGEVISDYRNRKNLTQAKLAEKMQVTKSRIIGIEGAINVSEENQEAYSQALDIPASQFQPLPLRPWALFALLIIALCVFHFHNKQISVTENPKTKAQFAKAVAEFPKDGRKRTKKAYSCFVNLSDTKRQNFWRYAKNYEKELLIERAASFKGIRSMFLSTFICGGDYVDFTDTKEN